MSLEILVLLLIVSSLAVAIPIIVFGRRDQPEAELPAVGNQRRDKAPTRTAHPEVLLVLDRWYASHACASCGRAISRVPTHGEPRPGLFDPTTGLAVCWEELDSDGIVDALATHQALCAGCFTAEWFRQQYPDRVVDRTPTPFRDSAIY